VDEAFLSRGPRDASSADRDTVARVLENAIGELAVQWPPLLPLTRDMARLSELAVLCEGWDGRRIRKLVLAALAQRLEVARDPAKLTWEDLLSAARKKGGVEWAGGTALTSREMFPDVPKELMHDHDHGHAIDGHDHGVHDHGHGPHRHTHTHQHDEDPRSGS
jgi:hypothetical protein